jgi:thiamine-monophosphate kinase
MRYSSAVYEPEKPIREIGERALLHYFRSRIPEGPGVTHGVGDDAAVVETGPLTLVTTDVLVEDVHFHRGWSPPRLLGRKALTVNLSDIAAMAGIPRYATVSLCLPPDLPLAFVEGLYDGLLERSAETGVTLVGGNLAASPGGIVVDITLIGQGDRVVLRSGAQPGDQIVVTGSLGAASEGLRLLAEGARLGSEGQLEETGMWTATSATALTRCLRAQLDPVPPLAFGRSLSERDVVHAAIDLSDGLSGDLLHLCRASGCAAWIDAAAVPVDPLAAGLERARGGDALQLALHGGEDYELLLAVPPDRLDALKDLAVIWDVPLSVVGEFVAGEPAVSLKTDHGMQSLALLAHDHFGSACPAVGLREA